jgi:predicted dehydrogenase
VFKRILIVGFGSIGKKHFSVVIESLPNVQILIFKRTKNLDEQYDNCRFTSDITEALNFRPDVAIIANPAPFHLEFACQLADLGCHLLIEKPIAVNLDKEKYFLSKVETHAIKCSVGYNLRHLPSLVRFKQYLDENIIGDVCTVRCETGQYLPSWRQGVDYKDGVSARSELGGGVLNELSHEFDYLSWIFGKIKWVNCWSGKVSSLDIDVEDMACILMGISNPQGSNELLVSLSLDFIRHDRTRKCIVIGSEGSLRWDGVKGTIDLFKKGFTEWHQIFENYDEISKSYKSQWDDFLDCIKFDRKPCVGAESGFQIVKVIEKLRESSAKHCRVEI